jgi:predicted nucleic acid-binding protein
MSRYVIGPDVALRLAEERAGVAAHARLLAPTLLRSEVLARLFATVRRGEIDRREAERRLDHIRGLRIRLLGDRVLQRAAWRIAERLDWPDTATAEYLTLTGLQGDAFVTLDAALAREVAGIVPLAPIEDLIRDPDISAPDAEGEQGEKTP